MSAVPAASPTPLSIHASAVVIGAGAILIRGPSGVGKSALALALIAETRQRKWFARLVADDRVLLRLAGERLIVAPHPVIAGRVERRFAGLATMPHEDEAVARLVVDLAPDPDRSGGPGIARLPPEVANWTILSGVRLRRLALPKAYGGAVETILHTVADFLA